MLDVCKNSVASSIFQSLTNLATQNSVELSITENDIYNSLERPPESHLGDYAIPCFRFAKPFKQNPNQLAQNLAEVLKNNKPNLIKSIETVGAFINISLDPAYVAETVIGQVVSGDMFKVFASDNVINKQRVMIEFSQPNTHKEFHVGHIRNVALGDALCRMFRYCGHLVVAANYYGDEGAHIAKCLWYLDKEKPQEPEIDKGEWLGELYTASVKKLNDASDSEKTIYNEELSKILREVESKQGHFYDLWKTTRQWSIDSFKHNVYEFLDVNFDVDFFESELTQESQRIVDEYLDKGIFVKSEGAIGIDLSDYKLGFLLLRKSDGNTLYATKDLSLARKKFEEYKIERSIYVVASEQKLHFKQCFKTLEIMGVEQAKKCFHLSYGLVVLPDGKMSSRQGNIVAFSELKKSIYFELDNLLSKYKDEWSSEEIEDTKHKLCVGAVRYGMLNTDPVKDVVFDLKEWLSFEGNSGPYLMYSYARTQSILKKAAEAGYEPRADKSLYSYLSEPETYDLIKYIQDFNATVLQATEGYKPSTLSHFLFDMCKAFNRFYIKYSVLKAENDNLILARLLLVQAFSITLQEGLGLLGINPPSKM